MGGPVFNAFAAAFGATLALVICIGAVMLRSQRAKLRHSLLLAAMEKDITLPESTPQWLASLRLGVSIVVIGVVMMLVGVAATGSADKVPMPPASAMVVAVPPTPPVQEFGPDGRPRPSPPPPETPEMRQWHQAQDQKHLGLLGLVCGLLLSALGMVRVVFAWVERKYTRAAGLPN